MRFVLPPSAALAVLLAFVACSSSSPSSTAPVEAGASGDDGDTSGCTSVGGTCEPYAAGCPLPQQNPVFCGNAVLVCCLQPGGETVSGPPDAGSPPVGQPDSGTPDNGPPDSGKPPVPDAGMTMPRMDAGSTAPPEDAGTNPNPKDAQPE